LEIAKNVLKWFELKHSLVQILVVVATIQANEIHLKADVEKGFKRTLIDLE